MAKNLPRRKSSTVAPTTRPPSVNSDVTAHSSCTVMPRRKISRRRLSMMMMPDAPCLWTTSAGVRLVIAISRPLIVAAPVHAEALEIRVELVAHVGAHANAVFLVRQIVVVIANGIPQPIEILFLGADVVIRQVARKNGASALADEALHDQHYRRPAVGSLEHGVRARGPATNHQDVSLDQLNHGCPPCVASLTDNHRVLWRPGQRDRLVRSATTSRVVQCRYWAD